MTTALGPQVTGVQSNGTGLVRSLTLTHTVLYGVGVTIGAGIYVLVGVAAGRSGMHAPLGFLLAAIAMGMTAASFAELGTRMPVSASEAAYVERAFHRRWLSLGMGLLVIITATISGATISSGSAGYVAVFLDLPPTAIIVGVVLLMGAVACLATTQSIAVAGLMTLVEVGGLLVIIGAGMTEGTASFARLPEMIPSPGEGSAWMALGGTTLIAVFAFVGFEHIVNVAEEGPTDRPYLTGTASLISARGAKYPHGYPQFKSLRRTVFGLRQHGFARFSMTRSPTVSGH